jgi:5-methylcytosine-specific restriction endonuclease McrA
MQRASHLWWKRYKRYLQSREWQETRQAVFKRDHFRCMRCGKRGTRKNPIQAHHLSYVFYNTTGRTPLKDLQTLCLHCHEAETARRANYGALEQFLGLVIFLALLLAIYALAHR